MKKHIPSFFTCLNLICGFIAILLSDLFWSSWFIFAGTILDALDGFTARKLNAQSDIGKELDSMADLVSFGVAPAYLYHQMATSDSYYFYIPAVVLLFGSAMRLAIFNTLPPSKDFKGLATPAAAFLLFGIFHSYHMNYKSFQSLIHHDVVYFLLPILVTGLMIGNVRMFSLKQITPPYGQYGYHIVLFVIFLISLMLHPPLAPIIGVVFYVFLSLMRNTFRSKEARSKL